MSDPTQEQIDAADVSEWADMQRMAWAEAEADVLMAQWDVPDEEPLDWTGDPYGDY